MRLFKLLALKGTWLIVLSLYKRGPMKYSEIVKLVGYSTTANRALKALEKEAFIEKRALTEPYRPVIYSLSKKGEKLARILEQLKSLDD